MTGNEYRVKAAELSVRARTETNPILRTQLEQLTLAYLRLAEQADRNAHNDIVYETPPRPPEQRSVQQQQQPQPKPIVED